MEKKYGIIASYAYNKNVAVAFENLYDVGGIACLMDRYNLLPNVGFCYDCGHEHCYSADVRYLDLFHKKLICTHIHDNFGPDKDDPHKDNDIHVLPYDGDIDYSEMIKRYERYGCTAPLTLEVGKSSKYGNLSDEEWLLEAHRRLERIYAEAE